jgi:hypothetical protein
LGRLLKLGRMTVILLLIAISVEIPKPPQYAGISNMKNDEILGRRLMI